MRGQRIAAAASLVTGMLGLAALFFFVGAFSRTSLISPFTSVGPLKIGLLTREEAFQKLTSALKIYEENPQLFVFQNEIAKIPPQKLGVHFDASHTLGRIPALRTSNNFVIFWDTLAKKTFSPEFNFSLGKVEDVLEKEFSQVKLLQSASFRYDPKSKNIVTEAEREGFTFDREILLRDLESTYDRLSRRTFFLRGVHQKPVVTSRELADQKDTIIQKLPRRIFLRNEKAKWKLQFPEDIEYLDFEKPPFLNDPGRETAALSNIIPAISEKKLERFLEKNEMPKALENPPEGVKIFRDGSGQIIFEGKGKEGHTIDRQKLQVLLEKALFDKLDSVQIPLLTEESSLEISGDLQRIGIHELIGVGYTTYYGSPSNRKHNIAVGMKKYNGMTVSPGAVFSFNENLGPVEAYTGYKPELVIKADGTKPEYGGGLCQVSTTMYRAAMYTGLPILERSPHSYAVTYYSQVGGHGLDATIYPGVKDLKFLNDTTGHILIQAYAEEDAAYFKFYGTSDGRKISFEGPFISNRRGAPPDAIIYTTELPAGKKKQEEKPHAGFDALWYRYVTKNGETEKETVFSRYRAIPAKFLVGGEGPSVTDPTLEAARQFE